MVSFNLFLFFNRLLRVNGRKLLIVAVILFTVFLLAGGASALISYVHGAKNFEQYRADTLAPLFGGCLLVGTFGLLYAYKNRGSPLCLAGFFITFFCYGFIEYLYQAIGGI